LHRIDILVIFVIDMINNKQKNTKMKFKKDKKYSFISYSEPFNAEYPYDINDVQDTNMIKEVLRWEIESFRGFSAYDSPKHEDKNGRYVKTNYILRIMYETQMEGYETSCGKVEPYKTWLTFRSNNPYCGDFEWSFVTKKEMMEFLNKYMDCMVKGVEADYGYYNSLQLKITKGVK